MSANNSIQPFADLYAIYTMNLLFDKYPYILVVEGSSDVKTYSVLFQEHIQDHRLLCYPANCKEDAISMVENVIPDKKAYCRAVVDRDYDFFISQKQIPSQIVYTDAHSLETQLWMTDYHATMLPKIVNELVDNDTISSAMSIMPFLYEKAYDTAYKIGLLRLSVMQNGWRIKFNGYTLEDWMFDEENGELNIRRFVESLCRDNGKEYIIDKVLECYTKLEAKHYNRWQIMQGHDISTSFVYYIMKKCTLFVRWNEQEKAVTDFERRTRMVCNVENMRDLDFYKSIDEWATASGI